MNAKPIIFRQGEENGIVIERKDFENSIFVNQYNQAIEIFNRLWSQQEQRRKNLVGKKSISIPVVDNQYSNIISFCGDRGEGKTSCMSSFATVLAENEVRKEAKKTLSFPKNKDNEDLLLSPEMIDWLDVIDPSFFDEDHNLLELLLGRMYYKVQRLQKSRDNEDSCNCACTHRELMEQFQKVKKSISTMTPQKDKKIYDTIEDISDLAAGMRLREEIEKLFMCYLQYAGKECLLICIDDLDLNISQGYKMAEMLRKYLINPYCIILVSVKIEQLIDIIATAHKQEVKNTGLAWSYCMNMAQKYVAKLLPRGNQVPMPSAEDICERKIQIAEINEKEDKIGLKDLTVKERVVQLIFQKTGYVFYNGQYLSPIVPTNLRSLRHLLSTLETLPDARNEDGSDNETGREVFKNYFFGTWAARLESEDYVFAQQLADYTNLSTLNAFVVEYLAKRLKEAKIEIKVPEEKQKSGKDKKNTEPVIKEANEEEDGQEIELDKEYSQLYLNITKRTNTSTNISFGDAMYVLWLISTITLDKDIQNLIFYVKTVYSMRLYACYNEVIDSKVQEKVEQEKTANKDKNQGEQSGDAKTRTPIYIHKADHLYESVNSLQRLTNGAYFTYPQGAFLEQRSKKNIKTIGGAFRDRYSISFARVRSSFEKLCGCVTEENLILPEDKLSLLHFCEYMALCIARTTYSDEKLKDLGKNRSAKTPTFVGKFSASSNFAMFDFLHVFYSLCNIEYAYRRFDEITGANKSLYTIAINNPDSLLSIMYNIRNDWYNDKVVEHGVMSDAIIRVVDIQWSIFEEMLRQKHVHKRGTDKATISAAYSDICDLGITLYPKFKIKDNKISNDSQEPHPVEFVFLRKIHEKINKLDDKLFEDLLASPRKGSSPKGENNNK